MRRRFLRFLAITTFRHAWFFFPLLALLTAGAVHTLRRMEVDTSLVAFLPPASPEALNIREVVRDYRNLEPIVVTVRSREPGHEAVLMSVATELARWLDDARYFLPPIYRVDELAQDYYSSLSDLRLIQLLTPEDWAELRDADNLARHLKRLAAHRLNAFAPAEVRRARTLREDPLGALEAIQRRVAISRGPTRLETRDGYFMSPDGRAIYLLLYPVVSAENGRNATRILWFLQSSRRSILERRAPWADLVEIDFAGNHVTTARQIESVQDDFDKILKITVPLAFLLVLLVFHKLESLFFIFLPPAIGLVWTLALATLAFNGISAVMAAFLIVISAMGIGYSIHMYHRFTLELYQKRNYYRALSRSYVETGRGVLASAVIVTVLFALLFVTSLRDVQHWRDLSRILRDSQGLAQFGIIAAIAILCNMLACLIVIPLFASLKALLARGRVKPVQLYRFSLERFYEPAVTRPRMTLGVMLLLSVFLGYQARNLDFFPRFASISAFFYPADEQLGEADNRFGRPGRPVIAVVRGDTLQRALEQNDQLYRNLNRLDRDVYGILSYDSLRIALPSIRSQQEALNELRRIDLARLRDELQAAAGDLKLAPGVFQSYLEQLRQLQLRSDNPDFLRFSANESDALKNTVWRYLTSREDPDGKRQYYVATMIYPRAGGFPPDRLDAMTAALRVDLDQLELIGDPFVERELAQLIKYNLAIMILMAVLCILLGLILHFRSSRLAWLVFIPVVAEIVWICGLMALANLRIHFFTVLALPLILSLVLDNALQLTQYHHDRRPCSVRHAMLAVGRVIPLTAGIMALCYGTFALMRHPGFRQFGLTVLLGSAAVLVGSAMLLPALLQLLGRGQSLGVVLRVDSETEI
ncbi:MAG TPA: MMPL family transporter [Candidatus Sumerlaeota bacterium]|nr:MMPL family transporter [Candidatus Sumerlaeota bacterium]